MVFGDPLPSIRNALKAHMSCVGSSKNDSNYDPKCTV